MPRENKTEKKLMPQSNILTKPPSIVDMNDDKNHDDKPANSHGGGSAPFTDITLTVSNTGPTTDVVKRGRPITCSVGPPSIPRHKRNKRRRSIFERSLSPPSPRDVHADDGRRAGKPDRSPPPKRRRTSKLPGQRHPSRLIVPLPCRQQTDGGMNRSGMLATQTTLNSSSVSGEAGSTLDVAKTQICVDLQPVTNETDLVSPSLSTDQSSSSSHAAAEIDDYLAEPTVTGEDNQIDSSAASIVRKKEASLAPGSDDSDSPEVLVILDNVAARGKSFTPPNSPPALAQAFTSTEKPLSTELEATQIQSTPAPEADAEQESSTIASESDSDLDYVAGLPGTVFESTADLDYITNLVTKEKPRTDDAFVKEKTVEHGDENDTKAGEERAEKIVEGLNKAAIDQQANAELTENGKPAVEEAGESCTPPGSPPDRSHATPGSPNVGVIYAVEEDTRPGSSSTLTLVKGPLFKTHFAKLEAMLAKKREDRELDKMFGLPYDESESEEEESSDEDESGTESGTCAESESESEAESESDDGFYLCAEDFEEFDYKPVAGPSGASKPAPPPSPSPPPEVPLHPAFEKVTECAPGTSEKAKGKMSRNPVRFKQNSIPVSPAANRIRPKEHKELPKEGAGAAKPQTDLPVKDIHGVSETEARTLNILQGLLQPQGQSTPIIVDQEQLLALYHVAQKIEGSAFGGKVVVQPSPASAPQPPRMESEKSKAEGPEPHASAELAVPANVPPSQQESSAAKSVADARVEMKSSYDEARARLEKARTELRSDLHNISITGAPQKKSAGSRPATKLAPVDNRITFLSPFEPFELPAPAIPLEDSHPTLSTVPSDESAVDPLDAPFVLERESFTLPEFQLPSPSSSLLPGPSAIPTPIRPEYSRPRAPSTEASSSSSDEDDVPQPGQRRRKPRWLKKKIRDAFQKPRLRTINPLYNVYSEGYLRTIVYNNPALAHANFRSDEAGTGWVPVATRILSVEQERAHLPHYRVKPIEAIVVPPAGRYMIKGASNLNPDFEGDYVGLGPEARRRSGIVRRHIRREELRWDWRRTQHDILFEGRYPMRIHQSKHCSFRPSARHKVEIYTGKYRGKYRDLSAVERPFREVHLIERAQKVAEQRQKEKEREEREREEEDMRAVFDLYEMDGLNDDEADERDEEEYDGDDEDMDWRDEAEIPDSPASPESTDEEDLEDEEVNPEEDTNAEQGEPDKGDKESDDVEMKEMAAANVVDEEQKETEDSALADSARETPAHVTAGDQRREKDDDDDELIPTDVDEENKEESPTTPPSSPPLCLPQLIQEPQDSSNISDSQHSSTAPSHVEGASSTASQTNAGDVGPPSQEETPPSLPELPPPADETAVDADTTSIPPVPTLPSERIYTDEELFQPSSRVPVPDRWNEEWRTIALPLMVHTHPRTIERAGHLATMLSQHYHQPGPDGANAGLRAGECITLVEEFMQPRQDEAAAMADHYRSAHMALMRPRLQERRREKERRRERAMRGLHGVLNGL